MKKLIIIAISLLLAANTMASKSRGGLSKREYAAKQAKGKLDYKSGKVTSAPKKSSVKSSTSGKVWVSATKGNLDPTGNAPKGQFPVPDAGGYWQDTTQPDKRVTAYDPGGSPIYGDSDYSKEMKKQNSTTKTTSTKKTEPKKVNVDQRTSAANASPSGKLSSLTGGVGSFFNNAFSNIGGNAESQGRSIAHNEDLTPAQREANILAIKGSLLGNTAYAAPGSVEESLALGNTDTGSLDLGLQQNLGEVSQDQPYGPDPVPDYVPKDTPFENYGTSDNSNSGGGRSVAPTAPAEDMGYDQQLNNYLKGFGKQEDSTEKFYKKQLRSLDPLYEGYQNQAKGELETARQKDLNALAALFSAYNTGDSEQRMQQQERTMSDYGSKLSDLIQQMQLAKQKESMGIQENQFDALNSIAQARQSAQLNVANLLNQAKQQQFSNSLRGRSGGSSKIPGVNSNWQNYQTQDFINKMLQQRYSWQDIADTASANNMDTSSNSYLDKYLRSHFGY